VDIVALVLATTGCTTADIAHVARVVAQATFEKTVDTGARCFPATESYLRTLEATRPTVTDQQAGAFESDIEEYAHV
jgi:transitional endoplasmic reticulum ATPase